MKYICNFSGGLCSFWATYRTVQKHGAENVVRLFADTLIESPGLYKFMEDATPILGVSITRISKEITPWDLFKREGLIGNDRFPICSTKLKREPLNEWMESNYEMRGETTVIVGFEWTEEHRLNAMRAQHRDWTIEAPMCERPIWDKCRMRDEAVKLGLEISDSYRLNLPHDNCGGGCVKAGISHWAQLYKVRNDTFLQWEKWEWDAKENLESRGIKPMSMLKDRRGGTTKNLYLRDLRARIEAGEKFDRFDWGGCGCGGATTQPEPQAA